MPTWTGRMIGLIALVPMTVLPPVGGALLAQAKGVAAAAPADADYILGTGDVIEVAVLGRDDYRARVRVQTDGSVQLPLIGSIPATGRTTLQLRDQVRQALRSGGYFSNPVVSVEVTTFSSRYVTVLGEVAQPGLVPIDRGYRVSEIIARVGGVKDTATDAVTLRRANGTEQQLPIVALATGGPAEDPVVNPGDKLFVAQAKSFYIYGQVTAPGNYRLDPDMTLRKAIARGGGLTESGSEKRAKLYRDGQEIKRYKLNDPIQPGDVVVVGERFF